MATSRIYGLLAWTGLAVASPLLDPRTPPPFRIDEDCTSTVTSTYYGFTGNYQPTTTTTQYPSTVTVTNFVDCHGCKDAEVAWTKAPNWGGVGPEVISVVTTSAATPTTVTAIACSRAPRRGRPNIPGPPVPRAMEPGPACTTTKTVSVGPWWQTLTSGWDTLTVHTATQTVYEELDCKGCALAWDVQNPGIDYGIGPVLMYKSTTTAAEPETITSTVCAGQTLAVRADPRILARDPPVEISIDIPVGLRALTVEVPSSQGPDCTATVNTAPHMTGGSTETFWTTTVTETATVDCGGCTTLTLEPFPFGPGPLVRFTTTTTAAEPTTTYTMVCSPTPNQ